jgi:hypothetical protein
MKTYRLYAKIRENLRDKAFDRKPEKRELPKTFIISGNTAEEVKKKFKTSYGSIYVVIKVVRLKP